MNSTQGKAAVLAVIRQYARTKGYPPTVREIAEELDIGPSRVHEILHLLVDGGEIRTVPNTPRTIQITPKGKRL